MPQSPQAPVKKDVLFDKIQIAELLVCDGLIFGFDSSNEMQRPY